MTLDHQDGPWTVVSFHAHPDDEALLTGGTLARLAAEGHRVVVVVATSGDSGLAAGHPDPQTLGRVRLGELEESAMALGVVRVVCLGHRDSGSRAPRADGEAAFSTLAPGVVAAELAAVLREEGADVLTTYDAAGGYGHPDHVQVHRVGALAADLAGTPLVLEASFDRDVILRVTRVLRRLSGTLRMPFLPDMGDAFTPRSLLTHRVDVRPHLDAKVAALRAHASQAGADDGVRTIRVLLGLPRPLRRRVLGTEWFREVGRAPGDRLHDDVLLSLRGPSGRREDPRRDRLRANG